MMLDDIRKGRLNPAVLTPVQCGSIYDGLWATSTYQSPKVIEIYAQQSFGNTSAMPIDTWIATFLRWPLTVQPTVKVTNLYQYIFSNSQNLGKVERLLWVAGQARKVHSSACNDAFPRGCCEPLSPVKMIIVFSRNPLASSAETSLPTRWSR